MINRDNYWLIRDYLVYRGQVLQHSGLTLQTAYSWLKHLLRWADEETFTKAVWIRPVFPQYLLTVETRYGQGAKLTQKGVAEACEYARHFFSWAREQFPSRFTKMNRLWVDTLRPPPMDDEPPKQREYITLEMVRVAMAVPENDYVTRRDKAALAFLYLSAMRASAFCSLPLKCVSIETRQIQQFPTLGVKTKNRKAAVTRLHEIPDLIDVVAAWDAERREHNPPEALWYPAVGVNGKEGYVSSRPSALRAGLERLSVLAGQEYLSPHKARHGHAVYGLQHAKNMQDLKALSMNMMHSSIGVTDSIYAVLSEADAHNVIASLGKEIGLPTNQVEQIVGQVLARLASSGQR